MLSQKRRRRRVQHGLRTVELRRGINGFGFTISGQQPCVLSHITPGSPADEQGIRDGDHLVLVNNQAVSQLTHDEVVGIIGSCSGSLKLQITEQTVRTNDSSDEEYVKPRYNHRSRQKALSKEGGTTTNKRTQKKDRSNSPANQNGRSLQLTLPAPQRSQSAMRDPFPTVYNPTRPINGRSSDFGVVRQQRLQEHRIGNLNDISALRSGLLHRGHVRLSRSNSNPEISAEIVPSHDEKHKLTEMLYPAMQPMQAQSSSSTLNTEISDSPSLRVIVGYIGSIEMPQDSNRHNARLQSIRSAVRRLRIEQKVHTLVLLEIRSDGIKLINPMGVTIVHYPVERLAMSGMYPDDKRFFGLVTNHEKEEDDPQGQHPGSSCHVFMVDPEFAVHGVHVMQARKFGIQCTIDPSSQRCIEFPKSCTPILKTAARLYRDKHGGIFEVPRAHREERRASSDSDTNSDSGVGFHKDRDETNNGDRVYVVDVHIPGSKFHDLSPSSSGDRVLSPPEASGLQRSQTPVKHSPASSRSSGSKLDSGKHKMSPSMAQITETPLTVRARSDRRGNVFDIRATSAAPAALSPAAVTENSPLDPHIVEQLKRNMQRLLAKRNETLKDTHSLSDTESVLSESYNRTSAQNKLLTQTKDQPPIPRERRGHHGVVPAPRKSKSSDSESSSSARLNYRRPASTTPHNLSSRKTVTVPSERTIHSTYQHERINHKAYQPERTKQNQLPVERTNQSQFFAEQTYQNQHPIERTNQIQFLAEQTYQNQHPIERTSHQYQAEWTKNHKHSAERINQQQRLAERNNPAQRPTERTIQHPPIASKPQLKPTDLLRQRSLQNQAHNSASHEQSFYAQRAQTLKTQSLDARSKPSLPGYYSAVPAVIGEEQPLSSKLSPRAYPQSVMKQPRVTTSDRSAFHKVTSEPPPSYRQHQLYQQQFNTNHNNNNSNNGSTNNQSSEGEGIDKMKSYILHGLEPETASQRSIPIGTEGLTSLPDAGSSSRPVPAPRQSLVTPYRACSVPVDSSLRWYERSREVNVDDGMSIRSESETSNHLEKNERVEYKPTSVGRYNTFVDKALSSESLVEVGQARGHVTLPKQVVNNNNNVGRVASWAVTFENLLHDEEGVQAFTEFLTKEYSQENIHFWLACEKFKQTTDPQQLVEKSSKIFSKHLSRKAPELVNIDSRAMKLAEDNLSQPSPSMFNEAQTQVFLLMKTDSYSRFIKSEFYQSYLIGEFEHEKLNSSIKDRSKSNLSDISDSDIQKKRSIPGLLKEFTRSFTTSRSQREGQRLADGSELQKQWNKGSDDSSIERVRIANNKNDKKYQQSLTVNINDMQNRLDNTSMDEESYEERLLRVVLPDGSTSVLQSKPTDTIRGILTTLFNKKPDLSIAAIDVFPIGSDKWVDINACVRDIPDQEFRVERRALFRLDLPNRKSVGVKAKAERSVRDVLRPILHKYSLNMDNVLITLAGEQIKTDSLVSAIDGSRITIITKEEYTGQSKPKREWGISTRKQSATPDLINGWDDLVDFEKPLDVSLTTSQKKSKGTQLLGLLKHSSEESKLSLRRLKGKNVTFGPTKSMDDKILGRRESDETFIDMISKVQSSRFDDQRGISVTVGELPDFLKAASDSQPSDSQSETQSDSSVSPIMTRNSKTDNSVSYSELNPLSSASPETPRSNPTTPRTLLNNTHQTPDHNSTLTNTSFNKTLTPGPPPNGALLNSPLPINLPPPPQFGNEALTPQKPPPYSEAVNRSFAPSFNTTPHERPAIPARPIIPNHTPLPISTIPGNNPGNRLSFAHHNPIIINESIRDSGSDRSTPSPTTHSLILVPDDEPRRHNSEYNFYSTEYNRSTASRPNTSNKIQASEPVKVTFV